MTGSGSSPVLPHDPVGKRVSVRSRTSGGAMTDTIGVVLRQPADLILLGTRDGTEVGIRATDMVALRHIRPGSGRQPKSRPTAYATPVADVARAASAAWAPRLTESIGQWLLRSSAGFTGRANTALPVGPPGLPMDEAIAAVTDFYLAQDLTPGFQVIPELAGELEAALSDDWVTGDRVVTMVADIAEMEIDPARPVHLSEAATAGWLSLCGYDPGHPGAGVLTRGDNLAFASIGDAAMPAAVARGAVIGPWLGITAMQVAESARRQGMAQQLLAALANWGRTRGARFANLQVLADNLPARAAYAKSGFAEHHRYHYRWLRLEGGTPKGHASPG